MAACTFFGHRECPDTIQAELKKLLIHLIEEQCVNVFYAGHQGAFDRIVRNTLHELTSHYPHIKYYIILAYMPKTPNEYDDIDYTRTLLPDGIETVPKRFAISWRNKWILRQADCVVTYVTYSWGGAAKFAEMATRQKKHVINLSKR